MRALTQALRALVIATAAMTAAATLAMSPAAASPNLCTWYTDQDIADSSDPSCRATYLVDVGQGNHLNREHLLAAGAFYNAHGFGRQFLWYSEMRTVHVPNTFTQQWTGCEGTSPRGPGATCTGTIDIHPMNTGHALKPSSMDLLAFAWDGGVIVRACGNYFEPTTHSDPVPSVSMEKFDDRNRNGLRDPGENGLSGWQFDITRIASKYHDQDPGFVDRVTTDGSGLTSFFFRNQGPGTYTVTEVGQPGWAPTTAMPQTVVVEDGIGNAEVAHLTFGNAQTQADLAKIDFGLVNPPDKLDAHVPVDLTVRATVRNNGPADVSAVDSIDVAVQPDCVATPAHAEATRVLAAGQEAVIEFVVQLRCDQPSFHPTTFTDHLAVATAGVDDPLQENNTKAIQPVFPVYDRADIQMSDPAVQCPQRADITQAFACTVTTQVVNAGPYGPATADVTFAITAPADCTVANIDGMPTQTVSLAVGTPQTLSSRWQVACGHRSFHDIAAAAEATLNHEHLIDPVAGNASGSATTRIEIFEAVDLVAVGLDARCTEREVSTLASDCTATFKVRNDGPATDVAVLATVTIAPEPDCTATPDASQISTFVLAAGQTRDVVATWHLTCTQSHRHSVVVTGTIGADEPHAEDRGPRANTTTTTWGPGDVKPRSLPSAINLGKEGVIPFALLSTPTLNTMTDVDPGSVRLAGADATCATQGEDVNDDGRLDLICRVDTQATTITCNTTVVLITAVLSDGTAYQSEDSVKITGCK